MTSARKRAPRLKKAARSAPALRKRRPVADPAANRRYELVLATYQLIAEKGLAELRTRDVAARVGVNVATLHYYFARKELLLVGVVNHVTYLFAMVRAPLPPGATSLHEFQHLFESQEYRRQNAPELDIVVSEIMLLARRDETVRSAIDAMLATWRVVVEAIVARCIRDGYFHGDQDPRTVAMVVTSFLIGANTQLSIRDSSVSLAEVSKTFTSWLLAEPKTRAKKRR
jgi:AcrR family transcriptional regulator